MSTISSATLSSPGIGSGLDVTGMVNSLMAAEQAPLKALTAKQSSYTAKLSAYGALKSALASFQSTVKNLSDPAKLQAVTTTSGDSSVLSASGGAGAVPGTYSIEVTQLAQAQKLVAAGQASDTAAIGSGLLTFDFGSSSAGSFTGNGQASQSVSIGTGNNTLAGIRDAINAANIGISASVVNDGSSSPYRLSLANTQTGAANSMRITVGDGSDGAGSSSALAALLTNDPAAGQLLTQSMAAQNATLKVDGILVSKAGNSIADAVPGVTLTLQKSNAGSPTSLGVAYNTASVTSSVQAFVSGYNSLSATLKNLSSYNLTGKTGAVLNGDSLVRSIQSQLRSIVTGALASSSTGLTRLNQIGVSMQKDGTLALDANKLKTAISTQFSQLSQLFAATGSASDAQLAYASSSSATKAGSYAVSVSQMATQGSWLGQSLGSNLISITAGVNDSLQITLDSLQASLTLAPGSYSASALAAAVQARINGISRFSDLGSAVTASIDGNGALKLLSTRYGAASNISLDGSAASVLLGGSGASATTSRGLDMSGQINGVAVSRSGQYLSGAPGDAAEGLRVNILGGGTGSRGNVLYTQGFAYQIDQLASSLLADTGMFSTKADTINSAMTKLGASTLREQDRLSAVQASYQAQFTKLDSMMSKMNSTSSYLTQQLTALAKGASIA